MRCALLFLFSEISEGEEKLALPFRGQGFYMASCRIHALACMHYEQSPVFAAGVAKGIKFDCCWIVRTSRPDFQFKSSEEMHGR
jgi:hypothetical protein